MTTSTPIRTFLANFVYSLIKDHVDNRVDEHDRLLVHFDDKVDNRIADFMQQNDCNVHADEVKDLDCHVERAIDDYLGCNNLEVDADNVKGLDDALNAACESYLNEREVQRDIIDNVIEAINARYVLMPRVLVK